MIELECYLPELTEEMEGERIIEMFLDRREALISMDVDKLVAYARKWHFDDLLELHKLCTAADNMEGFWVLVHLMRMQTRLPPDQLAVSEHWLRDRGFVPPTLNRNRGFVQWLR